MGATRQCYGRPQRGYLGSKAQPKDLNIIGEMVDIHRIPRLMRAGSNTNQLCPSIIQAVFEVRSLDFDNRVHHVMYTPRDAANLSGYRACCHWRDQNGSSDCGKYMEVILTDQD